MKVVIMVMKNIGSFLLNDRKYTIEFQKYEGEKKMKLKDLMQGMVCKLRNGESITVANSGYYFTSGFIMLTLEERYNKDLTHKKHKRLDIMEITYGDEVVFERNESNRWFVPEVEETYYYINNYGDACLRTNSRAESHNELFDNERVFKTKEEAEKRLRQKQATFSVERWIAENDVEVDVFDTNVAKWFIAYNISKKELAINYYIGYIIAPKQFILSSEEKALQLIKEREKELKIMFGVE